MAEHWVFLNKLRHDLGKGYTVAEEQTSDVQRLNLLVLRRRDPALLTVTADTRWLALLAHESTPATRVEYKHLVVVVRNFFARPDTLPSWSFHWPGTQESREELRHTVNPRRRQRVSYPG